MRCFFSLLPLLCGVLPAQIVTATAISTIPTTVISTATGFPTMTTVRPAGTSAPTNAQVIRMQPALGVVSASALLVQSQAEVTLSLLDSIYISPTATNVGAATDLEMLLSLSSSAPVQVGCTLQWTANLPIGQPVPTVSVDFANTGTLRPVTLSTTVRSLGVATLGATPFGLRVRLQTNVTTGTANSRVTVVVRPLSSIQVAQFATSCASRELLASTTFADELWLRPRNASAYQVLVIGYGLGFYRLPSLLPCYVMPSVDLAVPLAPAGELIPRSRLPGTFYAQVVEFGFSQASSSNTLQVR